MANIFTNINTLSPPGTNQWTVCITSVQPRNQGHYECQISTKPVKAFQTYLQVLGEGVMKVLGEEIDKNNLIPPYDKEGLRGQNVSIDHYGPMREVLDPWP